MPILFISARNTDDDKIIALNIGGDDYVEKPYSLGVLLAKVKVVLKRFAGTNVDDYNDGYLAIDSVNRCVLVDGEKKKLTSIEYKLLEYMTRNANRLITKAEIFDNDCKDKESSQIVLDACVDKYEKHIVSTMNFYEMIEGSLTTFQGISALMLILMCVISAVVIMLILYLLN